MQVQSTGRHLNFNRFIEERAIEIASFAAQLQMDTKKKGHQALPKSVRRRAMSHNRFRVPRKLRKSMDQELAKAESMQRLPVCRKHIRKRRLLARAYQIRSGKSKWLSTHLWSAKRMRMVEYYGYKISETPNDKCFRSAYRRWQHGCAMTDLSYYNILYMSVDKIEQVENILKRSNGESLSTLKNRQIHECNFYEERKLVCPGLLIKRITNQKLTLRFIFHPAALNQITNLLALKNIPFRIQQGYNDLYLLIGPRSTEMIQKCLTECGIIKENAQNISMLPNKQNKIIYFTPNQPFVMMTKPLVSQPLNQESMIAKQYKAETNRSLRNKIKNIFANLISQGQDNNVSEDVFWKDYQSNQNEVLSKVHFNVTVRSKYTHKRSNKLTKSQKKQVIKSDKQSESQQSVKKQPKTIKKTIKKQTITEVNIDKGVASMQQVKSVMIAQAFGGYLILCSNFDNCRIWRTFSKMAIKVVGKRQLNHYYFERGIRKFPQDYHSTMAYEQLMKSKSTKQFQKESKIPLPKRPNYISLKSPKPYGFYPSSHLQSVQIQMVSRGCCQINSYICQLEHEDLQKIVNELSNGKVGIVCSQQVEQMKNSSFKTLEEAQVEYGKIGTKRKIIGKISSGGYRYSHQKQGGIGFIDQERLTQGYKEIYGKYVLIRKVTSPHYFLGIILSKQ